MRLKRNGSQLQIVISDSMVSDCELVERHKIEGGELVKVMIPGYGLSGDIWLPDGSMSADGMQQRKDLAGLPAEFAYKFAKDFDWTLYGEDIETPKKMANAFVLDFPEFRKQGRGLYIYSATKGSGKTMLACCLTNEIIKRYDVSVKYVSSPEYLELCKGQTEEDKERAKRIRECRLLILDDIGTEPQSSEWQRAALFHLIDYRDKNFLCTIYTSNLETDELKIDERAKSRIFGHSQDIYLPEVSIRKQNADRFRRRFADRVLAETTEPGTTDLFRKEETA